MALSTQQILCALAKTLHFIESEFCDLRQSLSSCNTVARDSSGEAAVSKSADTCEERTAKKGSFLPLLCLRLNKAEIIGIVDIVLPRTVLLLEDATLPSVS